MRLSSFGVLSTRRPLSSRNATCEPLDRRLLMAAGDPDVTFNNGIPATISFPGSSIQVNDVALQSDGRVIAVGTKAGNIAMARLNVDGSLDTTFGNQGLFESNRRTQATSVAIQQDDKILITFGVAVVGSFTGVAVGRVTANGSGFDSGFGTAGIAFVSGVLVESANAVTVQRDGKIVVAGSRSSGSTDFTIARYNANGSPDTSFDDDGLVVVGFGDDESAAAIAIDYNGTPVTNPLYGTIVVVGDKRSGSSSPSTRFTICRLRSDGALDDTFDSDGKITSPDLSPDATEFATGVQIQPGGKIVVSGTAIGTAGGNFLLARYLLNGAIDTTFGPFGSGIVHDDFGGDERAVDLAASYLGGFLVSGSRNGSGAVAAYTRDGLPETRFGGDSFITAAIPGAARVTTSLNSIAPVRRLVLGGGNRVGRFIDVGSVVSIRSFDHEASEAGQDPASFFVQRTQPRGTTERVYLNLGGTARPPYLLNADYTVSGMTIVHPIQGSSFIDIPPNETVAAATITPVDDALAEGDETIVFTIAGVDTYDISPLSPAVTLAIRDNDSAGAPVVSSAAFIYDAGAPQRVRFTFSQDVAASIAADDLSVSGPSGAVAFAFNYDSVSNTATLSFSGVLPDGDYTARALAGGITNGVGQAMPADHVLAFFFLAGDANRDRRVDIADFAVLAGRFNLPGTFSQGDFNYSGTVEIGDFSILASKFNTGLSAAFARPSSSVGLATAAATRPPTPSGEGRPIDLLKEGKGDVASGYPG